MKYVAPEIIALGTASEAILGAADKSQMVAPDADTTSSQRSTGGLYSFDE